MGLFDFFRGWKKTKTVEQDSHETSEPEAAEDHKNQEYTAAEERNIVADKPEMAEAKDDSGIAWSENFSDLLSEKVSPVMADQLTDFQVSGATQEAAAKTPQTCSDLGASWELYDSVETYTMERLEHVMSLLNKDTARPAIHIKVSDKEPKLADSKFGGVPYLPKNGSVPVDDQGHQLRLLAQIHSKDLPANDFWPIQGLLQFWVLDNENTGADFKNLTSCRESRVIHYAAVDEAVTEADVLKKYHPYCGEDAWFPVRGTFSLEFNAVSEGMSTCDYRFDPLFASYWNKAYPDSPVDSYFDLPSDIAERMFDEISGFGHKLGGYPAFTQEDPRDGQPPYKDYEFLLLQIDSQGTAKQEIMWGDSGVCTFFITYNDLKVGKFDKVLYTWDCY